MDYNIRIVSADKVTVQETGETIFSVQYSIFEIDEKGNVVGDEAVYTGRDGFPLGTSSEDIIGGMQKLLATYKSDKQNAVRNEEFENANAVSDAVIEELVGLEITSEMELALIEEK